jgi:hypothetical protein
MTNRTRENFVIFGELVKIFFYKVRPTLELKTLLCDDALCDAP